MPFCRYCDKKFTPAAMVKHVREGCKFKTKYVMELEQKNDELRKEIFKQNLETEDKFPKNEQ